VDLTTEAVAQVTCECETCTIIKGVKSFLEKRRVNGICMRKPGRPIILDCCHNLPRQLLYTYHGGGNCWVAEITPCNPCRCLKHHPVQALWQHGTPESTESDDDQFF